MNDSVEIVYEVLSDCFNKASEDQDYELMVDITKAVTHLGKLKRACLENTSTRS